MQESTKTVQNKKAEIHGISILRDILKEWWVILLVALSASMLTYVVVSKTHTDRYTAASTFVVYGKGMNVNIYNNLTTAQEMAEQFSEILKSNVLRKKVEQDLEMNISDVVSEASIIPESNMMVLQVTGDSPMKAYKVLHSIMNNYNTVSDYVLSSVILEEIQPAMIPAGPSNAIAIDSYRKRAFMAAAFLMLVLIGIFSYMKDTIKGESDVSAKLDMRLLGSIPHEQKNKSVLRRLKKQLQISMLINNPVLSFRYVEQYRMLASKVLSRMKHSGAKVLLVTSVTENEGKSTVAANLAMAMSQEQKKVLLIDCDFRKPAQYKIFQKDREEIPDFGEILKQNGKDNAIIKQISSGEFYAVFNSSPLDDAAEVVGNGAFGVMMEYFRQEMDYIVLDTPPMAMVADAEELAPFADAAVMVIKQDRVYAQDINDAADALENTGTPVLGCVFNDVRTEIVPFIGTGGAYGYGYGYGRYGNYYGNYQRGRKHE